MPPNICFDVRRVNGTHSSSSFNDPSHNNDTDDSERREEAFLLQELNTSSLSPQQQMGRMLWENVMKGNQKDEKALPRDEKEKMVLDAMSSILVLKQHQDEHDATRSWLEKVNGSLYNLPTELLESVKHRAPHSFNARVADFNDNLFYEMQSQRGLEHLGLSLVQDLLQAHEYLGSFLTTESSLPQPPHVDYTWDVLDNNATETGEQNLQIGFFPLTKEGMFLQVWPRNDDSTTTKIDGKLIYIPYGNLLVVPASTIHGGGFRTTPGPVKERPYGNLRFHLYLSRNGKNLPTHQTNKYTEPNDRRKELSQRYVDAPNMDVLLEYLFV